MDGRYWGRGKNGCWIKVPFSFLFIRKMIWGRVHGVQYFMNISGDERNMARGSRRWKSSIMSGGGNVDSFAHVRERWRTQATREISKTPNENQAVNPSRSPLLSFVFGIKVPPSHKSQILYDTVEIALSRMQSAKAASSADELPWLRERQWHVSFAPSGCTENTTGVSRRAAPRPPNGSTSFMLSRTYSRHGSHLLKKIFVLLVFRALATEGPWLIVCWLKNKSQQSAHV